MFHDWALWKNAACWPKSALFKWRFGEALLKAIYTSINGLLWNQKLLIPLSLLYTSCKPQFWIFTGLRRLKNVDLQLVSAKKAKEPLLWPSWPIIVSLSSKTPRNGLVKTQCKASLSSCVQSVFVISYSEEWSKFTSISVVTQKENCWLCPKRQFFSSFMLYMLPQSTVIWQWEHPVFQLVRPPLATINWTNTSDGF